MAALLSVRLSCQASKQLHHLRLIKGTVDDQSGANYAPSLPLSLKKVLQVHQPTSAADVLVCCGRHQVHIAQTAFSSQDVLFRVASNLTNFPLNVIFILMQTWINEKHNAICEICDQPYKGPYTIPPPPQPEAGEQLQVIAPSSLYLTVEDDRVANLLSDVYDDWDDHRQPTVSWCFSLMMFLLFLMFLHSSVSVLPADGGSGSSSSGGPGSPPSLDPSGVPAGSGSSSLPGGAAAGFAAGASLFLMWLLTKLFLIMLPLLMVMRLAARAQEQAAEAAAAAPAEGQAVAGSGGSSSPRYYQSMVARMLGSNGYRGSSSPGHGRSSSLSDLEMEVGAARRAALNRLGRNPTFLGPAAAAALPAGANRPVIAAPVAGDQQHEQVTAAEQRMMAAVRAMVRAALVNAAAHQEHNREGDPPATGNGSAPTRLSGVV